MVVEGQGGSMRWLLWRRVGRGKGRGGRDEGEGGREGEEMGAFGSICVEIPINELFLCICI